MSEKCNCKMCKVVEETIYHMSNCDNMDEAIDYFESIRHKQQMKRTKELFDELFTSQLATLFKLLIDTGKLKIIDNKISK